MQRRDAFLVSIVCRKLAAVEELPNGIDLAEPSKLHYIIFNR